MSPEEMFAKEEHVALERVIFLKLRDGTTGPEMFLRLGRLEYVVPLTPGMIAEFATYGVGYMARMTRLAMLEEANGGG